MKSGQGLVGKSGNLPHQAQPSPVALGATAVHQALHPTQEYLGASDFKACRCMKPSQRCFRHRGEMKMDGNSPSYRAIFFWDLQMWLKRGVADPSNLTRKLEEIPNRPNPRLSSIWDGFWLAQPIEVPFDHPFVPIKMVLYPKMLVLLVLFRGRCSNMLWMISPQTPIWAPKTLIAFSSGFNCFTSPVQGGGIDPQLVFGAMAW